MYQVQDIFGSEIECQLFQSCPLKLLIWEPYLGTFYLGTFGNLIWEPYLGTYLGTLFGNLIWEPYLGTLFGNLIWEPYLGTLFGNLIPLKVTTEILNNYILKRAQNYMKIREVVEHLRACAHCNYFVKTSMKSAPPPLINYVNSLLVLLFASGLKFNSLIMSSL